MRLFKELGMREKERHHSFNGTKKTPEMKSGRPSWPNAYRGQAIRGLGL
jgi:hypothetical protein